MSKFANVLRFDEHSSRFLHLDDSNYGHELVIDKKDIMYLERNGNKLTIKLKNGEIIDFTFK